MADTDNDLLDDEATRDVCLRLRGKMAARFRRILAAMKNSEDLEVMRLGEMSLTHLGTYGLGEWMKHQERVLGIQERR